ncbi:hypothetical protein EST38_g13585 [Candolleomyces aberdarensis]|uniref:BTB domain-containing protein n=1 Tax=Candolleomyces aberdarensis TaxID=2316362 RepID=A0A4Q2CZF7_9AGAR|nr:hypothetical protein EST38_g13585 [Candolleomyces aberdarensis]
MSSEESALWSVVFFKVEDTIFQVPTRRFTENSEVFANMFLIPQAGDAESVEGSDKEHPIVLDGYEATDFRALMKVLYPALNDVISGLCTLKKDEWVGVLNLSTRWQMKLIREHAIENLSKMSLTSFEKVTFARAHKVAKWLKEGLNEIVAQEESLESDELKSQLGLETAFRLMWIQNQSLKGTQSRFDPPFTLKSLGCCHCRAPMFISPRGCCDCGINISVDDPAAIYAFLPSSPTYDYSNFKLSLEQLRCTKCERQPIDYDTYGCPSCSLATGYKNFRLVPSTVTRQTSGSDVKVNEAFNEEITGYESWDQ